MAGSKYWADREIRKFLARILSTCDPPLAWRQQAHEVETRGPERNRDSPVAYCRDAGFRAHFMFCILYDMKTTIDKDVIGISKGSHLFSTSPRPYGVGFRRGEPNRPKKEIFRPLHHFLRILFLATLFRVRAFLLHLSKRLCHVFDLMPNFKAYVDRGTLRSRHRDTIAGPRIDLDLF